MRIIKFKGKSLEDGQWNIGDLTHAMNLGFINPGYPRSLRLHTFGVYPATVCQFTGLLDKNGKEIYEGDVLRSDTYPFSFTENNEHADYYGTIGWSKDEASFYIKTVKNPKSPVRGIYDGICNTVTQYMMHDFEVIGNIHEEMWQQYGEQFKTEEEKEADND